MRCWRAGTGYALADWLRSRGHEPQFIGSCRGSQLTEAQDDRMEVQQGTRHPRPELPAAHPEGQEGAGRHGSGEVLKVVSTDPGSVRDFQAFARQTGNELVEQSSGDNEFMHYLRRR